jgi:hypothetical protein
MDLQEESAKNAREREQSQNRESTIFVLVIVAALGALILAWAMQGKI